ncbi:hypothetical protein AB0L57_23915 [Nocardia sp. NPDC052254]|uniref:hypothetical protein n=1 Tax=Nocardia sp. NPDC052254 TaxID=3155681 RepID=UPI00343A12F9
MDGTTMPNPVNLVVGAAARAGGTAGRMLGFGLGIARRVPGVQPALTELRQRGAETLGAVDALTEQMLHAGIRRVVRTALDAVDLTAIVVDNVDLDAVAERIDVDKIIGRVDLVVLADTVIEGVDLPRIIRESTDSMSAEAVLGIRSQGMHADDAVAGFVGRLIRRAPPESGAK